MSGSGRRKPRQIIPFGRPLPVAIDCVPRYMLDVQTSGFHTTDWTIVLAAGGRPTEESEKALERLCQTYWKPVYAFIRRRGHSPDQAQDLCQGFFAVLLEKNYLVVADKERGKFRSFLLTAVKNYLADQWDRSRALKRGGGQAPLPLDVEETERWYGSAVAEATTPETLFERRWALSLLEHVLTKLRAEFATAGKADQFDELSAFLSPESETLSYEDAAQRMGLSAGALRTAVYRLRRRYRALLRAEIAETTTPEETDDEIRFLLSALGGT
jgi:RNA polymerase sigma-70 factor (ECF subfamily)